MQRHMNSKHSISDFAPYMPMSQEKCQRFQLVHPFTCIILFYFILFLFFLFYFYFYFYFYFIIFFYKF